MKTPMIAIMGMAAATALSALVPGCSSKSNTPSSTTTGSSRASGTATSSAPAMSAPAAPTDYTTLLIQGSDIQAAPDVFAPAESAGQNPDGSPGARVLFQNRDNTNKIVDTILILPDAAGATTAMNGSLASVGNTVAGGTPQPVSVGNGGTIVAGASPDKSKSVTVLLFTEGKAFTTMEFDGAPNDAVPPDFATSVAQQQDAAIKKGLPG